MFKVIPLTLVFDLTNSINSFFPLNLSSVTTNVTNSSSKSLFLIITCFKVFGLIKIPESLISFKGVSGTIKLKIIDDFKNGCTSKELIDKYGCSKTTINDWLRTTRLEIGDDDLKSLRKKYSSLCKEHEKMKIELEIYKSLECLPSSPRHVKLNAIEKYYNIYPVKTMCRILDVSVGTFYNHLNRRVEEKFNIKNDNFLRPLVMEVYNKSRQRFGSIKIAQVLRNEGYTISNKKSKHLMDELNIKPILGKKKKKDLSKIESKNIYLKNLIGKNFTRNNPNEAWTPMSLKLMFQVIHFLFV